jgi:hypothetical protein
VSRLARARDTIVAYVSLLFGAGLSVGANLADTLRIRGHAVDTIDIALAVGPPLAALLVVELFVSAWPHTFSVQSVRWVATLIVGTLATIVSWIHIHELLAARGQNPYVAMLWPVAIDGLAIMAMAKLLVTRGHVASMAMATEAGHPDLAMATEAGHSDLAMATQPNDPTIDLDAELASLAADNLAKWTQGYELAISDLGQEGAREAEAMANGRVATQRPVPVLPSRVPADVRALIVAMLAGQATKQEIDEAVMEMTGRSQRVARRLRAQVSKEERDAQEQRQAVSELPRERHGEGREDREG